MYDGNTVAWYKHNDSSFITYDGALRVSSWRDRLGSGHDLLQGAGASQPLWSAANGILFDGGDDFMKTLPFAFVQPEFIYFVGRQVTWTSADTLYDGNLVNTCRLLQKTAGLSPELQGYVGIFSGTNSNLILNTFGIIRFLVNGVASIFQVNLTAAWIGNMGAANAAGFTLGTRGDFALSWSNIEVKEIILRNTADNAAVQLQIYNYLKNANGL